MYTSIAVALDGSRFAEQALPFAVKLAIQTKASLALVQAVQTPIDGSDVYNRRLLNQAENYLLGVKGRLLTSMPVEGLNDSQIEILTVAGNPIEVLSELNLFGGFNLLIMTTHGRSGLLKLLTGSVAAGVVREANFPVILLRPEHEPAALQFNDELLDKTWRPTSEVRIGLTLDGRAPSEAAVFPAIALATQLGARLYLLETIPTIDVGLGFDGVGYNMSDSIEMRRERAYLYLNKVQDMVVKEGVECVKLVLEGNPDPAVTNWAKAANLTILVMATSAPNGFEALLFGSTVADVIRHSHLPVMVVRATAHSSDVIGLDLTAEKHTV